MKYLKNRFDFLNKKVELDDSKKAEFYNSSKMIREVFENDITWGGSLLGRLINSTIRKSKIYYKATKIPNLIDNVRKELDALIAEAGTNKNQKNEIESLTARFLLTELFKVVSNDDSVDKKLTSLIGDGKSNDFGILNETITEVEKLDKDVLEDKEDLLAKLEDFREALSQIEFEPKETENEEEKIDDSKKSDKPEFNFFIQTMNLFKSLISLNNVIQNKRVLIEEEPKEEEVKVEVGKEYLHTNENGEVKKVKVVSLTKSTGKQSGEMAEDVVFVEFIGKDNKPKRIGVPKSKLSNIGKNPLKEGFLVIENVETIKSSEKQAKAAWRKILSAAKNSNLLETSKLLQEIINLSKSGNKLDKTIITAIGKNVILNEATTGKPIGFDALIKEEAGNIPTKYNNVSKSISLISRILLSFKDDMGLIGSFGEASKPIKEYISSYNEMKKILPNLPKKDSIKESVSKLYDYSRFRMFEAINKTKDKVVEAWYEFFEENEEKNWTIDEKKAKSLQEQTDKIGEEPFAIDEGKQKDNIIRIVNLFGKAYRLYATNVIPSGRPEGRISQKTFREYTYIGDANSVPQWEEDSTPGYGPWAAIKVFQKWEDGINDILEDQKYRKILANARFLPKGVEPLGSGVTATERGESGAKEKEIRAGRSLLDFMNDMLAGEGEFRKHKKKILKEYFSGADDIDSKTKVEGTTLIKTQKEEKGEKNVLSFVNYSLLKRTDSQNIKMKKFFNKNEYGNEFFKIEYKNKQMIGYIMGKVEGDKDSGLLLKFQFSPDGKKQSIVDTYLSNKLSKEGYKLFEEMKKDDTLPTYIGIINTVDFPEFRIGREIKMNYSQIIAKDTFGDIKEETFKPISISTLASFDDPNWKEIKIEKPENFLSKDIKDISVIKPKLKEFGID